MNQPLELASTILKVCEHVEAGGSRGEQNGISRLRTLPGDLDRLLEALDSLDDREKEVIRLYFGLSGQAEMTLEEIGLRFKLTRERVRQIKEKALRKLRHPARGRRLVPYYDSE